MNFHYITKVSRNTPARGYTIVPGWASKRRASGRVLQMPAETGTPIFEPEFFR